MTEKLLETLTLPVLPVYYGHPNVINITNTPSFIKASDFPSAEALAKHLVYLDENVDEYNKYHVWRKQRNPFAREYLDLFQNRIAGPLEVEKYAFAPGLKDTGSRETNVQNAQRRALCCRLCDKDFVKQAKASRTRLTPDAWTTDEIIDRLFGGVWEGERPGLIEARDATPPAGFAGSTALRG
jgi:hypothetical protein